jgi:hypothetical protein
MNYVLCGIAILLALTPATRADDNSSPHTLNVTASEPQIHISRRAGRRDYLHLPSLEYAFLLSARCGAEFEPLSVSLSIADSRKSLPANHLAELASGVELKMTVPAKQLAPLAIENFCVENEDEKKPDTASTEATVLVHAIYSAQASLLCGNDDQQQIVYASRPLDVTLICGAKDEQAK